MPAENLSAPQLWARIVQIVKDRVNNRSLWETMEQTVGIAVEEDTLIIGLNSSIFNKAGHLNVSEHRNAIEHAVAEAAGRPLKVRIIEGDTLADWAATKKRDARVAAMREATYERRDRQEAEAQNWDTLYEYAARAYSNTSLRQLPQAKARYLTDMLYALADAMDRLCPEEPDENTQRLAARVMERVAGNAGVPATLVALELERLRTWRKQNAG
jgi:hypothetical protein